MACMSMQGRSCLRKVSTNWAERLTAMFLNDNLKIFSGSSNPSLASEVCKYLGLPLGGSKIDRFPDGEKVIRIEDDVRGRDWFVVQSTCKPVDEHLIELLIILDCLRRASAKRITA